MTDLEPVTATTPATTDMQQVAADVPGSWYAAMRLAGRIHATPFVPKAMRGDAASVMACILLGEELGLGPMLALQSIHVIEGRPSAAPELMRALVNRAGHSITVDEATVQRVTLTGTRADTGAHATVTWSIDDAVRAGLCTVRDGLPYARSSSGKRLPWETYPRAMLLARATSELCRMIFPDVTSGLSYTPEEAASVAGVEWNGELSDPLGGELPSAPRCDGNHAAPPCGDRQCWQLYGELGAAPPVEDPAPTPARGMTDAQNGKLRALYGEVGIRGRPAQLAAASALLGIGPISTHNELDVGQTSRLIDTLTAVDNGYLELVVDDQGDVVGTRPAEPQDATDG